MMIKRRSMLLVSAMLMLSITVYACAENADMCETEIETETEYVPQEAEVDEEEYPEILSNYAEAEEEESIELKAVFKTDEGDTLLYYRMSDSVPPKTWFFGNLDPGDGIDFDGFTVEVIAISDDKLDYLFMIDDLGE